MTTPKFVLRFDDVAPQMAWSKFDLFDNLSRELGIPLLVGVVPHCLDPTLAVEPARPDFWALVRDWAARGWTIAQHGYTHQYVTDDPGMLGIGKCSELAGLSYDEQHAKLAAGKVILKQHGVWQPVFMAPSHSFDASTLRALAALDFQLLTDGWGVYPYALGGLTAVPQLFATPLHFGFGVYSICLHVNSLTDAEAERILKFVRAHRSQFVSFNEAAKMKHPLVGVGAAMRLLTSSSVHVMRRLRARGQLISESPIR
jgi:predicted deacetylase